MDDFIGVVYLITNTMTGKKYVGQKTFLKRVKRAPLKGQKKARISYEDNDFSDYYGSSVPLNADILKFGKDNFRREIIRFCKTKSEQNYFEMKELMERDAILREGYYNNSAGIRIMRAMCRKFSYGPV